SLLSDNAEPAKTSYKQHLCIKGILEQFMRLKSLIAVITFTLLLASLPASAGTKEQLIQLQTQVQALQDQMARMQQSFDERMGVMKNLVEQTTDSVNKMGTSLNGLQNNLQQQNTASGTKVDQVSTQVQSLQDAVDELKGRLA